MNRIDRAVIGGLVLVLAVAAFAIGGSALAPRTPQATTGPSTPPAEPYREGILSRPTSVNPLAARTQADRDLVALVFSGLVADPMVEFALATKDPAGKATTGITFTATTKTSTAALRTILSRHHVQFP